VDWLARVTLAQALRTMRILGAAAGVCALCVGCSEAFAPRWGGVLSLQSGRTPAPPHPYMAADDGGGNQKWTVPEGYMPANRALSGRNSAMTTPASFEAALSAPSFDSRPRATTPISHAHASQAADSRADSASTMPHQSFCEDGKKWSPPVGYVPQPKSAKRDAENRKRLAVERRDESIPQEEEDSLAALILDTYAPAGEFRDLQPRTLRAFHHGHVPLLCGCFRLNWRGIELYHFNVFRCGYHCLERLELECQRGGASQCSPTIIALEINIGKLGSTNKPNAKVKVIKTKSNRSPPRNANETRASCRLFRTHT